MQRFVGVSAIALGVVVTSWCSAWGQESVQPQMRSNGSGTEARILPKYLTAEEQLIPTRRVTREDVLRAQPPAGDLWCVPEYAPTQGALVRWGYFNPLLTEFVVGFAQPEYDTTAYVLVLNASDQANATATLSAAGADMDYVEFIQYVSDTGWIRDYGPRFIFQDNVRGIVDPIYGAARPRDDAFPAALGEMWHEPVYDLPVMYSGGNLMVNSDDEAFMTTLVLDDNPALTEEELCGLFRDYMNVELTLYQRLPSSIDLTGHIDMWMILLSDRKAIVSEFTHADPDYPGITVTEAGAADLVARGYTVYRTPAHNSGTNGYDGVHYTYTNAMIMNDQVFIPEYGGTHAANDGIALHVYQDALPHHTIHQVDCADAITYAGAIHCLSMHVPAYTDSGPAVRVLSPDGGELWAVGQEKEITWAANDDEAITSVDLYCSTDGGVTFPIVVATGETHDGSFLWTIPAIASNQCRIKAVVHDADTNSAEDISDANFIVTDQPPQAIYSFPLDTDPGWTTEGDWEFGVPLGNYGDPSSGHTGDNVYGYNLAGRYSSYMSERHLTSTALDCSGKFDVTLSFWRWLGVYNSDHAYVRVSNDGVNWATLWENSGTVTDSTWVYQEFNISELADDQPTVYLRWTMGTTNLVSNSYGWNIDDIELTALEMPEFPGDGDSDGDVDLADLAEFVGCMCGPEVGPVLEECQPFDFDADDDVDLEDYAEFQVVFTGASS